MRRRGLHKGSAHGRHGLAAVLPMMAVRRARHRVAALHCVCQRSCAAVEGIGHECEGEYG